MHTNARARLQKSIFIKALLPLQNTKAAKTFYIIFPSGKMPEIQMDSVAACKVEIAVVRTPAGGARRKPGDVEFLESSLNK